MKGPMEQNFLQHLAEFRKCIIKIVLALLFGFILSLFLSKNLLAMITLPAGHLVFLRPAEALMAQLKTALLNGILVSLPVILWQVGSFLWPALYSHERKYLLIYLPFIFLMFCSGLIFGFFVIVRLGYEFLLSFATDNIQPMISLDTYLSFVLSSMLMCGAIFLLPILVLLLSRIGILKAAFLWKQQRIIIIGLAVLVALITPTIDAFSMILIFCPLLILLELSILLAWLGERKQKKKATD
jgi:sec-independent protein translocase protein TatC